MFIKEMETQKFLKIIEHVFTFSMHSKTNYPAKKSISDLDVELEDNLEDDAYIKTLKFYLK